MEQLITYVILLCLIVFLGELFNKSTIPLSLILVIAGMLLSFVPFVPTVTLDPNLILNIFLPMLIYQISAFSSWRDIKKQLRPIASLSIGHVLFITTLVAVSIHALIPEMGWPLAFVLGAILSPPDDVAIVSISEKIPIPERVFIILEGEGMFNDAAALILFRLGLAAAATHTFAITHAISSFIFIVVGETCYGLLLGNILGKIRLRITNTSSHLIISILTPFLAYLPMVMLGGTGVLATAVTGFLIGNQYSIRFKPEFRLVSFSIWPTFAFGLQGLIFLLVGLDLRTIYSHISSIPLDRLVLYVGTMVFVVIAGRFVWVYSAVFFDHKVFFPRNKDKSLPELWSIFLISWAGMRGGISLAAALALPALVFNVDGVDLRDLLIFLVFTVIIATLVLQGMSLPYIMKKTGTDKIGRNERYNEHLAELNTRVQMMQAACDWLHHYKKDVRGNKKLIEEVDFYINEYKVSMQQYKERIAAHDGNHVHDEKLEVKESVSLLLQIIKVEQRELLRLWREDKINIRTRNKLLSMLDHQSQRFLV